MFLKLLLSIFNRINEFYYLCGILAFILMYRLYTKRRNFRSVTTKLPTIFGLPFIGIAYKIVPVKKFLYVIESYFVKLKSATYCIWLGGDPFIVTVDPEIIKEVLSSDEFLNKSRTLYTPINNAIHNGIITSSAMKWKHNRKLISSSFTHKILTSFLPIFNKGTHMAINKFDFLSDSKEHEVFDLLKRVILQISFETTMGIVLKEGIEVDENVVRSFNFIIEETAKDAVYSTVHMGFLVHTNKYYRTINFLRNYVYDFIKYKRSSKKSIYKNSTGADEIRKSDDIFINQALELQDRGLFHLQDVISESHTMIAGSFETVSTTIYSTLVMLAMHSDVQEKLYEEVTTTLSKENFHVELENLQNIPYMDRVIDETLRLMPSIPVIGREVTNKSHMSNILLPRGIQIIIPIFNLHRRKDIWGPEAEMFNPDNFLPENATGRHPYSYIPFSKGSRNCIGWRYAQIALRVILLGLVSHFKFTTSFKYEDLVFVDHISLRYDKEPLLKIERRI